MRLASVPQTTATAATPLAPPEFRGVVIAAARVPLNGDLVQIDGRFCIPAAAAGEIGRPLHRALSCCVWGNGYQDSVDPFQGIVLFPDDETQSGGAVSGVFSFQIPMYRGTRDGSRLYLHIALGVHLSASIPIPL